jgi:hypothetical protein
MIEVSRDSRMLECTRLCVGAMLDVDKTFQALQEVVDVVPHVGPRNGGRALDTFDELLGRSQNQVGEAA